MMSARPCDALEGLREALGAAGARRAAPGARPGPEETARWSLVHGFAMLLIDGRLGDAAKTRETDRLLESVIDAAGIGD